MKRSSLGTSPALRQRRAGAPEAPSDAAADEVDKRPVAPAAPAGPWWGWADLLLCAVFLALALYSRLVNIRDPPSEVFDEVRWEGGRQARNSSMYGFSGLRHISALRI